MEVAYELTQKKTLKFFVEILQKKGGCCTLHNLSSRFGNEGFTQEMRQMVRGCQSGLKEFLARYPSLFVIKEDLVFMRATLPEPDERSDGVSVQEAKEFFRVKLQTHAQCNKVSIRSLYGHRSQAPPHVREICGRNPREFRVFLVKHPDTFSVSAEHVMLCKQEKQPMEPNSFSQAMKKKVQSSGLLMLADKLKKKSPKVSRNIFEGDSWKMRVLQATQVIASIEDCLAITDTILKFADNDLMVISLDCEGVNLGAKGQLTLMQIATSSGKAIIFDIEMCPEMLTQGGLKTILESDKILKIIHDCRNDASVLYNQYGILLRNILDTQSAHAVLQFQNLGKVVSKTTRLNLNSLCQKYQVPVNPMRDELKDIYEKYNKYWARRPLTEDMILYAATDVLVLINEQLYGSMINGILPEYHKFLSDLCTNQILKRICKDEMKISKFIADMFGC